jgi:RND family efflux transporter MFP subunit
MPPLNILLLVPLASLFLSGCGGDAEAPSVEPPSRPVKSMVVNAPVAGGVRSFPARIDAGRKAVLAFRVPGKVQEFLVKEGDRVQARQVVARLDPKDYQIVVNDRQATFDNAQKNFQRARELVDKGHISKMDYDRLEAEFKNARSALEAARQDLEYTTLEAPFDGVIAQRQIEQFEEVQAKQAVLALQNLQQLEVKFDVPESIIRSIRASGEADPGSQRERVAVTVSFDDIPGSQHPVTFKEITTKADDQTQTFQATYLMERLAGANILPGMTATVTVDLSRFVDDAAFMLPVGAVVGDYRLDPRVWLVDEQSMTLKAQPVQVGRMVADKIEVTGGLQSGMRIVTAGASFVAEGMKVTLLKEREQAEPRAEDLQ